MFKDGPSEHHGKYFNMPLRHVLPKPMQKPHPPLWVACSQLETLAKCGEWGMGALGFQFVSADAAHAWVHAYYNAFVKRQRKLADYKTNPNIALVSFFMCAKTDEEARARADGDTFFQFSLRFYGQSADRRRPPAGTVNMWDEYNKWKKANPEAHAAALRGGLIGSPETIRRKLHKFQSSNIDQVVLLNQAGRNTHEHICESLELFAKQVMPEFHEAHPKLLRWKEQVLNREIELEEIDTSAFTERYGGTMKKIAPADAKAQDFSAVTSGRTVEETSTEGMPEGSSSIGLLSRYRPGTSSGDPPRRRETTGLPQTNLSRAMTALRSTGPSIATTALILRGSPPRMALVGGRRPRAASQSAACAPAE